MNISQKTINTIRILSAEAIEKAKSGHPGLPLGAAPMAYTLWANHLNLNSQDPHWINRDRFILSAGHGSAMLYSLLHLFGFDVTIEDLKNFRQLNSRTPGHPEFGDTAGVEATTGPLGQGIAMAVGMAMAERHLATKFNHDGMDLIDHYTYVLCGDGDLQEGVSAEASSLAGTLGLGKLIVLYDSNAITIEGSTDLAFDEDVLKRYEAYHWHTITVEDGNDVEEIHKAIAQAKAVQDRPSLIRVKTEIGYGCPAKVGKASAHGSPLGKENLEATKDFLGWEESEAFMVPQDVQAHMKIVLSEKAKVYQAWKELEMSYQETYPKEYKALQSYFEGFDLADVMEGEALMTFEKDLATRAASGQVLNRLVPYVPNLFGGSADLAPSNNSAMESHSSFSKDNYEGQNIHFGIREHAMAAIANGVSLHGGLTPYVATFMVFSDYMKAAMRLSALMKQPVTYILTHDSIGVGEDGPTHQPIEQLAMLRSIPNMVTFRPADNRETAMGWYVAMTAKDHPTALVLSRQTLPAISNSGREALRGAYIVEEEEKGLDILLMASGSEVSLAVEAAHILRGEGYGVRVVSMPSMELFKRQPAEYQEEVLPENCRTRLAVEAASTMPWGQFVGLDGDVLGIDRFGLSGPGSQVFEALSITTQEIVHRAKLLVESK